MLRRLAEGSQGIRMRLAFLRFLYRQNWAVRENWSLAVAGVPSETPEFGEAVSAENYSTISPQTVGRVRSIVLELLCHWIA